VQLNIQGRSDQTHIEAFGIEQRQSYQDSGKNTCTGRRSQLTVATKTSISFAFDPYKCFVYSDFHHL